MGQYHRSRRTSRQRPQRRLSMFLLVLLLLPPCLTTGSTPDAIRAQSLSSSMPPLPAPLIVLANLDQRIGTARNGQRKERLTRQRHEALSRLVRQALSTGPEGLAPAVSRAETGRLQAAAVAVFVAMAGVGLLLIALTTRMFATWHDPAAEVKGPRFEQLLRLSFEMPLKLLVLLFAADIGSRVLFLGESDEPVLAMLGTLAVVVIVWALLRLINHPVTLYSKGLLQRMPRWDHQMSASRRRCFALPHIDIA